MAGGLAGTGPFFLLREYLRGNPWWVGAAVCGLFGALALFAEGRAAQTASPSKSWLKRVRVSPGTVGLFLLGLALAGVILAEEGPIQIGMWGLLLVLASIHGTYVVLRQGRPYAPWCKRALRALRLLGWVKIRSCWQELPLSAEKEVWLDALMQQDGLPSEIEWTEEKLAKGKVEHIDFRFGDAEGVVCRIEVPRGWAVDFVKDFPQWVPVETNHARPWTRYATYMAVPRRPDSDAPLLVPLRVTTEQERQGGWRDAWRALRRG